MDEATAKRCDEIKAKILARQDKGGFQENLAALRAALAELLAS